MILNAFMLIVGIYKGVLVKGSLYSAEIYFMVLIFVRCVYGQNWRVRGELSVRNTNVSKSRRRFYRLGLFKIICRIFRSVLSGVRMDYRGSGQGVLKARP